MTEGDLFVYYRKENMILMSFVEFTDMNQFLILATNSEEDKQFIGQTLPWIEKLMNKVIKATKLNDLEKHKIFKMIFGE